MVASARKGNTPDNVDDGSTSPHRTHAARHVLACISGEKDDLRLIRRGAALAQRTSARLTVLYVLIAGSGPRPAEMLGGDRLFARSIGAPLVEVPAASVADGVTQYAAERGVTDIVISETRQPYWHSLYAAWQGSLADELAERLEGVDIYVLGVRN